MEVMVLPPLRSPSPGSLVGSEVLERELSDTFPRPRHTKYINMEVMVLPPLRSTSPGSLVGSHAGSQSKGCEFESQLGQHSLRRLTKIIVPSVIRLSHQWAYITVYVEKQPVAWKDCCVDYWCKKARNHMNRYTGRLDMTE